MKNIVIISCLFGIAASANGQTYLSTLGSTAGNEWGIGSAEFSLAQQFTTGSFSEDIGSISVSFNSVGAGSAFTVSLFDDVAGQPGTQLANGLLSGPSTPTSSSVNVFDASGLTLAANTTYWVVFDNTANTDVNIANTQGGSLSTSGSAGWTLGSTGYRPETSGSSYNLGYTGIATPLFAIAAPAPEPSSLTLIGLGFGGLVAFRRRA